MERPDPARVAAELAAFAKYLKGMTDDQLARHLADFLARRPSGGKGKSTLSPFTPLFYSLAVPFYSLLLLRCPLLLLGPEGTAGGDGCS
jgi:hypothetical protein